MEYCGLDLDDRTEVKELSVRRQSDPRPARTSIFASKPAEANQRPRPSGLRMVEGCRCCVKRWRRAHVCIGRIGLRTGPA